jgi:hypothetical protein
LPAPVDRILQRIRTRLKGKGIAGTDIAYSFYLPTAQWLAKDWPQRLDIDWDDFEEYGRLDELLNVIVRTAC